MPCSVFFVVVRFFFNLAHTLWSYLLSLFLSLILNDFFWLILEIYFSRL